MELGKVVGGFGEGVRLGGFQDITDIIVREPFINRLKTVPNENNAKKNIALFTSITEPKPFGEGIDSQSCNVSLASIS